MRVGFIGLGPMGAKAGSLTIMCGGDKEVFQKALPVLEAIGKTRGELWSRGSPSNEEKNKHYLGLLSLSSLHFFFSLKPVPITNIDAIKDNMTPSKLRSATDTPINPKKNTPVMAISKKINFFLSIGSSKSFNIVVVVNVNYFIITELVIRLPIPIEEVYTK